MKSIRPPKSGDPVRARDAAEHLAGTRAALRWSVDGVDLEQRTDGQAAVLRPRQPLQLVEITSAWEHIPPGQDAELRPTAWHRCAAKILQRGLGPAVAWAPAVPEQSIHLWAPAAYPAARRDQFRGKYADDQLLPPRFAPGDWVWAVWHQPSGLWLLVADYERIVPARVKSEKWLACQEAEVTFEDAYQGNRATKFEAVAYDDYGVIAAHAGTPVDHETGLKYATQDTEVLLRYMPATGRWMLLLVRLCEPAPQSDPSQPSQPSEPGQPVQMCVLACGSIDSDGCYVVTERTLTLPPGTTWEDGPTRRLMMCGGSQPSQPSQPSEPSQPSQPSQPSEPSEPSSPSQPSQPSQPSAEEDWFCWWNTTVESWVISQAVGDTSGPYWISTSETEPDKPWKNGGDVTYAPGFTATGGGLVLRSGLNEFNLYGTLNPDATGQYWQDGQYNGKETWKLRNDLP